MKRKYLIDLNLSTICFPITAIASITHRISGFITFIIIGPTLKILKISLNSPSELQLVNNISMKFLIWFIILISFHHIFGGIRHILMDIGILKETLTIGKITSYILFFITFLTLIISGVLIW